MAREIVLNFRTNNDEIDKSITSISALKKELRATKDVIAGLEEGSDAFLTATSKAGQLKNKIDDINKGIAAQSGAPIERLSGSFDLLKNKVSSLNFNEASIQVSQLSKSFTSLKLSDITSGLGSLGKGFLDLGKAILSNPIFLIAAIIIGVGVAIFELKDKVKILGAAFDFFKGILDAVVGAAKAFTDAIGLTSFAAQESTQKVIDNSKKEQTALEERYNAEIELAKAAGKTVLALEKEKAAAILESVNIQIKGLQDLKELQGKLSEEQQKSLDELLKKQRDTTLQLQVLDIQILRERQDSIKKAIQVEKDFADELNKIRIAGIVNTNQRANELAREQATKEIEDLQKKFLEQKNSFEVFDKESFERLKSLEKGKADAIESINKALRQLIADNDRKAAKEALEKQLQIIKDGNTLLVLSTKEGSQAQLDAKIKGLNAESEFVQNNFKKLGLSTEQAYILIATNEQKIVDLKKTFADKQVEIEKNKNKELQDLVKKNQDEEISNLESQLIQLQLRHEDTSKIQKEILTEKLAFVLNNEKSSFEERQAAQAAYDKGIDQLRQEDLAKDQAITAAKFSIAKSGVQALSELGNIFISDSKKQAKFQKGIALANIAVDTAEAIASLVKASGKTEATYPAPYGTIAAVAQYAAGIVRILANIAKAKQILSSGGEGGGGADSGGGGGGSFSGPNLTTPQAGPAPTSGSQTFTPGLVNAPGGTQQQTLRVILVESDVTAAQNKVEVIQSQAAIG